MAGKEKHRSDKNATSLTMSKSYLWLMLVPFAAFVAFVCCWVPFTHSQASHKELLFTHHNRPKVVKLKHGDSTACTEAHILSLCEKSYMVFEAIADAMNVFYDRQNHVLGHTFFSPNAYSRQAYVANGYIGARISTLGQGFSFDEINTHTENATDEALQNGWPLFNRRYTGAFAAGFFSLQERLPDTNFPELYANGWDSVVSSLPYWANMDIILEKDSDVYIFNPTTVQPEQISNYHQNLSIVNGIVSTKLTWLNELEVNIDVFAHRDKQNLGFLTLNLTPLKNDLKVILQSSLDFNTSQRTTLSDFGYNDGGIYMLVKPQNVDYSTGAVISKIETAEPTRMYIDGKKVIEELHVQLKKGEKYEITKFTSISTTETDEKEEVDLDDDKEQLSKAKEALVFSSSPSDEKSNHLKAWRELIDDVDIYFPADPLLTLTAQASLFHLLANTDARSKGLTSALSTAGLSSDSYGGMVFWDTDSWIVPAILPFYPDVAKAINNYRTYTHKQAKANAAQYGYHGAAYPWVSGRHGNCTSAGPCVDYEYHINVDVALSSWLLYIAGEGDDYLRDISWPLLRDASDFLSQYTEFDPELGQFVTTNLTDPDEYANHIDNGAFTNSGIDALLKTSLRVAHHLGERINPRWVEVVGNVHLPKSESGITLEYTGMNASVSIKQADVVLLTFPLDNVLKEEESRMDLFYYSLKQADIGPAMTFPVFTVASSRVLNYGCSSQSYLMKSVIPYIRSPFAQYSEQADDNILTNGGTHPGFPFLTAHGGYLQAVVYGIMGVKYSSRVNQKTDKIERFLKFDPVKTHALPGGVMIKGFKYMGQRLDIILTDNEGIIRHHGNKPIHIEVQPRNPKSGNYTIKPHTEFIIPAFEPHQNIKGSFSECHPVANLTAGAPGEVALSAIDGNNYTYWKPLTREPGKLLIDLGFKRLIKEGIIIWGARPAKFFSLYAYQHTNNFYEDNFSDFLMGYDIRHFEKIVDNLPITISEPFDPRYLTEVKLLPNNETLFSVERDGVYSRYIIVEIQDAIDEDGSEGATLNEFALF